MIEYIFFDAGLRDEFVRDADELGIPCSLSDDSMGLLVAIGEEYPEELLDELEYRYDALQRQQASLCESAGEFRRLSGFNFRLPNGEARMLPVSNDIANRLIANFSLEEIQQLLDAAAACALEPGEEHLCRILRAGG